MKEIVETRQLPPELEASLCKADEIVPIQPMKAPWEAVAEMGPEFALMYWSMPFRSGKSFSNKTVNHLMQLAFGKDKKSK